MDHFGIGNALYGAAVIYFRSARRTGRTTALIESAKDGDRIVCADTKEADHLRRMLHEHGKDCVEVIVIQPEKCGDVFSRGTPEGRTIFDHGWLERYYLEAIEDDIKHIDRMQRESSGYGAAHVETRMAYEQQAKWRP